ncbi:Chondramide synthase cmdD [Rubripirellula tenax]|uniref:Chondramide synthase cmdD n=1 Tax=Rubripirellula tenax TaxID=2528015 RepID=A0A5C6F085_9BACT|nr:PEP-utilizing enzyme [Rubripirellula tenax]TWU54798.1 Chondramide synthase cmdD [Rubripirellula tenax]
MSNSLPFDTSRQWQHRLTRPVSLFGASLWYAWHPSPLVEELLGVRMTDALFVETKQSLVRRYRVRDQLAASESGFDQLVTENQSVLAQTLESARLLNEQAESAIAAGSGAYSNFGEAFEFFVRHGIHATVIPDGTVRAYERLRLQSDEHLEFANDLRLVSHYHRLITDVLYPIAVQDLQNAGVAYPANSVEFITYNELQRHQYSQIAGRIASRNDGRVFVYQNLGGEEQIVWRRNNLDVVKSLEEQGSDEQAGELIGRVAFQGVASGIARVVTGSPQDVVTFNEGDILVAPDALPTLTSLVRKCGGIITDEGGAACHAATVSREFKKPCIVGTQLATAFVEDGEPIMVDSTDPTRGVVRFANTFESGNDDEELDICDANRNVIGRGKRSHAHRFGWWHQTFHFWVVSCGPQPGLVFQKRSSEVEDYPGLLDVTASGHLTAGEGILDGFREVEEELGKSFAPNDCESFGWQQECTDLPRQRKNYEHHAMYMVRCDDDLLQYSLALDELDGLLSIDLEDAQELFSQKRSSCIAKGVEFQNSTLVTLERTVTLADFRPNRLGYYMNAAMRAYRLINSAHANSNQRTTP